MTDNRLEKLLTTPSVLELLDKAKKDRNTWYSLWQQVTSHNAKLMVEIETLRIALRKTQGEDIVKMTLEAEIEMIETAVDHSQEMAKYHRKMKRLWADSAARQSIKLNALTQKRNIRDETLREDIRREATKANVKMNRIREARKENA